jgi:hypothetical protein
LGCVGLGGPPPSGPPPPAKREDQPMRQLAVGELAERVGFEPDRTL